MVNMPGYNLYVMGEPALGRYTLVQDILQSAASEKETPDDWCYINNFEDERVPQTLRLLPGEGRVLVKKIEEFHGEFLAIDKALAQISSEDICLILVDQVEEALAHIAKSVK